MRPKSLRGPEAAGGWRSPAGKPSIPCAPGRPGKQRSQEQGGSSPWHCQGMWPLRGEGGELGRGKRGGEGRQRRREARSPLRLHTNARVPGATRRLQASGNGFCPHLPLRAPHSPPHSLLPDSSPKSSWKPAFPPWACWALCPVQVGFPHTAQQKACGGVRVPQRVHRGSAWGHRGSVF